MYTVGLDFIKLVFMSLPIFYFLILVLYNNIISFKGNSPLIIEKFNIHNEIIKIPKVFNEDEIRQVIFGSILGDANLSMEIKSINSRFSFIQSHLHYDYFISVWNIITQVSPCSF
jgi:hypothetical protein